MRGWEEGSEERDIRIGMADSLHCMAESSTAL